MNSLEYKEFAKRYEKFKKCNLPVPFWDEERQVREYVFYDENFYSNSTEEWQNYIVNIDLSRALEDLAQTSLYFSYNCGSYHMNEDGSFRVEVGHSHAHSLEEVIEDLYKYPESFKILHEDEEFYTKRELQYLKDIQNYLLSIGFKDIGAPKYDEQGNPVIDIDRYINKNRDKTN